MIPKKYIKEVANVILKKFLKRLLSYLKKPAKKEAKIKPIKYHIVAPVKYNKPTPFSGVPEKTGKPMIPSNR